MAVSATKAGYESSIFVVKPSEKLECPICFNILNDPRQCSNGHLFCHMCISDALEKHQVCPLCKIEMSTQSLCKCLFVQSTIEELDTYCFSHENALFSNTENKCTWIGPLHNRLSHYENNCHYFPVKCQNIGCEVVVQRKNLAHHITENCDFALKQCQYCPVSTESCATQLYSNKLLKEHYQVCMSYPVVCVDCEATIPRSEVNPHAALQCKFRKVSCPLHTINLCTANCPKYACINEIEVHILRDAVPPMLRTIEKLQCENQELSDKVDTQGEEIEKLRAENKKLVISRDELQVRCTEHDNNDKRKADEKSTKEDKPDTLNNDMLSKQQLSGEDQPPVMSAVKSSAATADCDAADQQLLTATQKKNRAKKLARIKQQQQQQQQQQQEEHGKNCKDHQQLEHQPEPLVHQQGHTATGMKTSVDSSTHNNSDTDAIIPIIHNALEVVSTTICGNNAQFSKPEDLTRLVTVFIESVFPKHNRRKHTMKSYLCTVFRELLVSKPYGLAYMMWKHLNLHAEYELPHDLRIVHCYAHIVNVFKNSPYEVVCQYTVEQLVIIEADVYMMAACEYTIQAEQTSSKVLAHGWEAKFVSK